MSAVRICECCLGRLHSGRFSSQNSLYFETGWETLADRRINRKLTLMYRIVNADAPAYLTDRMPNRVSDVSNYNLRNNLDINIPFTRLCSFETLFFPSTLKLWNDLDPQIRCSPSLLQFKRAITHKGKATSFLIRGDRSTEIALTRIRHNCSSLNADLYRVNIIANPNCTCDPFIETAEHYFFECSLYAEQTVYSRVDLNFFHPNLDSLVNGNELFNSDLNSQILFQVFKFIKEPRRFSL